MSGSILEGVRVLDLTNVLAGPFATLHLALLGAEVIKIERPGSGDLARKLGTLPELNEQLMGTSFLAQNANKKSITLNTKSTEGKEIFRKLAQTADVLVENFRPGVMDRLGRGYQVLTEINPELPTTRSSTASAAKWRSTGTNGSIRCARAFRFATRWVA